jgi:hypothetical protein
VGCQHPVHPHGVGRNVRITIMAKIYTTEKHWLNGEVTRSNIWASKKSIAEKWAKQEAVNVLIDFVKIVEKKRVDKK